MTSAQTKSDDYIGDELELFEHADNWKRYFASKLKPYISGEVLEVGAGLGGTTKTLCTGQESSWTALEPDPTLCTQITEKVQSGELPKIVDPKPVTLESHGTKQAYDSVIYIDVMEHIEDDVAEASRAAGVLKPGGHLVILCPAHQSLYTPFDEAIGHFRRYSKSSLKALAPEGLELERAFYLDSVGLAASLANKLVLKQSHPTRSQISVWDNLMVPVSRLMDPLTFGTLGKTIVVIWTKPNVRS